MNHDTGASIGKIIRDARLKKGYTQKEIADRLGVTDKAVSKWECGRSFPDITMIASISRELDVSVSQLVGTANDCKEEAAVMQQLEKKIRTRITISAIVFAVFIIRLLLQRTGRSIYFLLLDGLISIVLYLVFLAVGVACCISSIILFQKRRAYESNRGVTPEPMFLSRRTELHIKGH